MGISGQLPVLCSEVEAIDNMPVPAFLLQIGDAN